ncbi:MAG: hypothetical protein JW788_04015 [Candidatus Omnitrophica bacterium]|nr:hypothetical protein [Candidatus Omnitrophota bacterium]
MRKAVFIVLIFTVFLNFNVYAKTSDFVNMRREIFADAQAIKSVLTNTKDMIILSSLWDACVLTMTQIDAYFSLLGIFNSIEKKETTAEQVDYLNGWLLEIKKTNDLNINSLSSSQAIEEKTKAYMDKLRQKYNKLNDIIANELTKLEALKKTSKKPAKAKKR